MWQCDSVLVFIWFGEQSILEPNLSKVLDSEKKLKMNLEMI